MNIAVALVLLTQAVLPPPGVEYSASTRYEGPGMVCGAAFGFRLKAGETATLSKSSAINAVLKIQSESGELVVEESQYATTGGSGPTKIGDGEISQKREDGHYRWIYRDQAPGSTDIYGPAVDAPKPTPGLRRVIFRSPRNGTLDGEACLEGSGSAGLPGQGASQ
jgi:hypothetical protein